MDPFSIEELKKDATVVGVNCIVLPKATYPIHIRGLGGRSVESAQQMIEDLTKAIAVFTLFKDIDTAKEAKETNG